MARKSSKRSGHATLRQPLAGLPRHGGASRGLGAFELGGRARDAPRGELALDPGEVERDQCPAGVEEDDVDALPGDVAADARVLTLRL